MYFSLFAVLLVLGFSFIYGDYLSLLHWGISSWETLNSNLSYMAQYQKVSVIIFKCNLCSRTHTVTCHLSTWPLCDPVINPDSFIAKCTLVSPCFINSCLRKMRQEDGAPRPPSVWPTALWLARQVNEFPHLHNHKRLSSLGHLDCKEAYPTPLPLPLFSIYLFIYFCIHFSCLPFILAVYYLYFIPPQWSTQNFVVRVQWQ